MYLSVDGGGYSQRSLRHSVTANLQVPRVQGSKGMDDEGPPGEVPFRPRPKCIRIICIQIEDYAESRNDVHFFPSSRLLGRDLSFPSCVHTPDRVLAFPGIIY